MRVRGALVQVGPHKIDRVNWSWDAVNENPFFCPDPKAAETWAEFLDDVRKSGSSTGAVIEVVADGVPIGLGAPLYAKLDQDIASGLMSINAVKGVEIGAGFASAALSGEENADEMRNGPPGWPTFTVQQCRRNSWRYLHGATGGRSICCKADLINPQSAQQHR